jgi:hypothetical protein
MGLECAAKRCEWLSEVHDDAGDPSHIASDRHALDYALNAAVADLRLLQQLGIAEEITGLGGMLAG